MEKAHGWTYVRSKSNGRKKTATTTTSGSVNQSPSTPFSPFAATPSSSSNAIGTPQSALMPSPWAPPEKNFTFEQGIEASPAQPTLMDFDYTHGRRDSITTAGTNFTHSSGFSPDMNYPMDGVSTMDQFNFGTSTLLSNNDFLASLAPQGITSAATNGIPDFTFSSPIDINLPSEPQDFDLFPNQLNRNVNHDGGFVDTTGLLNQDFQLFDTTSGADSTINWMDVNPAAEQYDFSTLGSMFPQ